MISGGRETDTERVGGRGEIEREERQQWSEYGQSAAVIGEVCERAH